jgi:hypothetical protein
LNLSGVPLHGASLLQEIPLDTVREIFKFLGWEQVTSEKHEAHLAPAMYTTIAAEAHQSIQDEMCTCAVPNVAFTCTKWFQLYLERKATPRPNFKIISNVITRRLGGYYNLPTFGQLMKEDDYNTLVNLTIQIHKARGVAKCRLTSYASLDFKVSSYEMYYDEYGLD